MVYAALFGNVLVTITKLVAAFFSGSSAMLSEGLHSFVDSTNELVLMYGMRQAARRPDREHPLGYGRELYFWSFIVAILVFALGAGISLYEGIQHMLNPVQLRHPQLNFIVLALSFLFELGSWWVAFGEFRKGKGSRSYWQALVRSKDPPAFMVLIEDSAALVGIAIAAAGIASALYFERPALDGAASVLIGVLLASVAALLARESKSLLIGEQADPRLAASITRIAQELPEVQGANGVLTVHLSPDQVVAALSLELRDELTTPQIETAIAELERRIRQVHPEVTTLFVKPQSAGQFARAPAERAGMQTLKDRQDGSDATG